MQISGMVNVQPVENGSGQQAVSKELPFAGASAGDTVEAEVVSVSGKEATLKTADGQEIRAQLPEGVPLRAGDSVEMTLMSRNPGTVYVRLNAVNGQTVNLESNELQVFLMDIGLPPSQVNEAATQLLLHYHIEPSAAKIGQLLHIAEAMPDLPSSVAVLMAANNIPATRENAEILMRWCTDPATLDQDIEEVGRMISQQSGEDRFSGVFRETVAQRITPEQETAFFRGGAFEKLTALLGRPGTTDAEARAAIQNFAEGLQLTPEEGQTLQAVLMEGFQAAQSAAAGAKEETGMATPLSRQPDAGLTGKSGEAEIAEPRQAPMAGELETPSIQKDGAPGRETARAAEGQSGDAAKLMEMLGRFFVRMKGGDIPADGKTLQETLKGQQDLAESVKNGVARMMGETSPAAQKAGDLGAQVRLGNQMEQFYYCQIPFETMERKGTAELYVFERRRNQPADEKTSVTVLIGLDTQYMGRVETALRSQPESLSVEFRVESERVERYLYEATGEFEEEMKKGGFPLSEVRVTRMKEPVTPMSALRVMEREEEIQIAGIDIRI